MTGKGHKGTTLGAGNGLDLDLDFSYMGVYTHKNSWSYTLGYI